MRIIKGMKYSEKYGSHPGTSVLVGFILMGFLAGIREGIELGIIGAMFMFIFFFPLYCIGAYYRGDY